jgi:hypothetical protein
VSWITVDISAGTSPGTIDVDLAKAGGQPIFGLRYAWGLGHGPAGNCCAGNENASSVPCPLVSCPLMATWSAGDVTLPANPFMAHIVNGKCQCVKPQVCDA